MSTPAEKFDVLVARNRSEFLPVKLNLMVISKKHPVPVAVPP
jgi:hypothetical protein